MIEIRTLIAHPMETGYRLDAAGRAAARHPAAILVPLQRRARRSGAELFPAVAANPYFAFSAIAAESGTLTFTWEGDNGFAQTETVALA